MEAKIPVKEIAVKKYVVRLRAEERTQLGSLIAKGKSPAQRLLKARILLKADVGETKSAKRLDRLGEVRSVE